MVRQTSNYRNSRPPVRVGNALEDYDPDPYFERYHRHLDKMEEETNEYDDIAIALAPSLSAKQNEEDQTQKKDRESVFEDGCASSFDMLGSHPDQSPSCDEDTENWESASIPDDKGDPLSSSPSISSYSMAESSFDLVSKQENKEHKAEEREGKHQDVEWDVVSSLGSVVSLDTFSVASNLATAAAGNSSNMPINGGMKIMLYRDALVLSLTRAATEASAEHARSSALARFPPLFRLTVWPNIEEQRQERYNRSDNVMARPLLLGKDYDAAGRPLYVHLDAGEPSFDAFFDWEGAKGLRGGLPKAHAKMWARMLGKRARKEDELCSTR